MSLSNGDPRRARTGISALKGLCPNHLDEWTIVGSELPVSGNRSYQDIIDADIE